MMNACAAPLLLSAAASAAAPFSVDLQGATTPFDNAVLTRCFGSSHAATALRADWRAQLARVHDDLGTEFVRFHGLLDDDMSVVIPKRQYKKPAAAPSPAPPPSPPGPAGACTFVDGRDYHDPGGGVYNASTKEECCALCYTASTGLPDPCVAAVWTTGGQCYLKLGSAIPVDNPPVTACVTDRPSPKGYAYSFVNIFSVFDFLVSIGMRPIVELGFMPSLLATDPDEIGFWYRGGHSPPKEWADWRDLMAALARALLDRYGAGEVHQWYFEVWNEPNCGFWDSPRGCCGDGCGNTTSYLELFTNTRRALKGVDPALRVGGPATAQLGWVADFLTNATAAGAAPDFVTTHLYPTDPHVDQGRDGFHAAIAASAAAVAAAAGAAGVPAPPVLITEFNCGLGLDCCDAPFAASFVAHHALRSQATRGAVPLQSYWTFSDIFEEQGQQASEFSQAFGALSTHGVAKPVYRAFQLVRRLLPGALAVTAGDGAAAVDVVVTRRAAGGAIEVEALVTHHPNISTDRAAARATNRAQAEGRDVGGAVTVALRFTGAAAPPSVELRRVDAGHANAVPAWAAAGAPDYPNATLLAAMRAASELRAEELAPSPDAGGGWGVSFALPPYAAASVTFAAAPA